MIKSRFSKAIIPLAFTTAVTGGMFAKTAISEKTENKIEHTEKASNPMEDPAVLGTVFTLGLLGTAGAAALGRAVDLRYKSSHEQIEDIYDIASLKEKDYKEALEEEYAELDKQGIAYNKEELKQKYTPMEKEDVLKYIDTRKAHLRRVTENVRCDKKAEQQLKYLIEEIKSGVKYDKDIDYDIKTRMLYFFDKATTPQKEWAQKEKVYKNENPDINFNKLNGIRLQSKAMHFIQEAVAKVMDDKWENGVKPEILSDNLHKIKEQITEQPEILNKYDREECLKLIDKGISMYKNLGYIDTDLYGNIINIFVFRQQTY